MRWKNDSALPNKTNYLGGHGPRAAACCKRKQRTVIFFSVSLGSFKGSQPLSAHNLFLFLHCFDVISCFPRRELVHSGGEMDKSGCATFWHWSKITVFPPSRHTLNKWEIREAERQMRGSCACVHFHMGLKRQKGQLVHSSLLCCVLGFLRPQRQIVSAGEVMCAIQ